MSEHKQAAAAVAAQVADFHKRKETFRIYHGSTNSTRIVEFDPDKMIDMSAFNHVLEVDADRRVAVVQANVPMDTLVEATLQVGLIPPVVMEFPGITVGGGYMGVAGESSSWKYGFFDRTVNWVDVILMTGERRRASATQNADLFKGLPGTYGTVAVTTLFEIQLIPAKDYVELEYFRLDGMAEVHRFIDEAIHMADVDYIDGISFAPGKTVIMLGRLTDRRPSKQKPIQTFSGRMDPWFYVHAEKMCKASKAVAGDKQAAGHVEMVPLVDYLFRYDRGAFWTGRYAFRRFHTPFNRVMRAILDPLMHTRPMYAALNASRYTTQYIIQDVAIPFDRERVEELTTWNEKNTNIWPVWLCPLRIEGKHTVPLRARVGREREEPIMLLNFGIWGPGPLQHKKFVELNRDLEATVARLGGFKWLYANAYYTEDEFWRIYDRAWYEWLRGWGNDVWQRTRAKNASADGEQEKTSGVRGVVVAVKMVARKKLGMGKSRSGGAHLLGGGGGHGGGASKKLRKQL
ncbi:FAD binding domain protein [Phyllosticta citribraziliensis]|uniref:Delta(24)-sterol reductase n=1 Tax=Phyllosticta citribraziliensis TaxID=989973 RepID=A0ABR1M4N7_9PEZI